MSKLFQPVTLKAALDGLIGSDHIKLVLLSASYTYSAAHDHRDDLTGVLATSGNLTSVDTTGGLLTADTPIVISGLAIGAVVKCGWFYIDTGTPSTSRLLVFSDKNADGTSMSYTGNGADVNVVLPGGEIGRI